MTPQTSNPITVANYSYKWQTQCKTLPHVVDDGRTHINSNCSLYTML